MHSCGVIPAVAFRLAIWVWLCRQVEVWLEVEGEK